jgi:NADP-dependent 3-hydroxy acid dehydrogenase YdfG
MTARLREKVALITGAGSGIGRENSSGPSGSSVPLCFVYN